MPRLALTFFSRSSTSLQIADRSFRASCTTLFGGRLRHQDHKLIAAVTGHHVRAPATLLQNVPDAVQYQVAFDVAVEIVDELKAVQIDQHQREGPARPRRALPLSGKRFHQKAVSLDAGEAVGNRLLLRFLESEGAMQRA